MVMANLEAGRYFGEVSPATLPSCLPLLSFVTRHTPSVQIALMIDMPRTANVTANERCLLLVLGIDDFRNFLQVCEQCACCVDRLMARCDGLA